MMRSPNAFLNSRSVPLLVVAVFILGMLTYSQASKLGESKDGNRKLSQSYPKIAYQAAYEQKSDAGTGIMVVFSDGMGHVRVENNYANTNGTFTTIYNFLEAKKYFLQESAKNYRVSGMSSLGMGFMDEDMFISTEAENLGTQDINGRPALGYRSKLLGDGAAQIESWFDKATGALMRSKNQNVTYTLTRFTNKIPQSYLFQVPKDYKEVPLGY